MQLIPEFTARFGIHPRGGLIEQEQPGLVQHASGQRHPLFPASRQLSRQLMRASCQTQIFQRLLHHVTAVGELIDAGHKVEVLLNGEVIPEGEPLRHVSNVALDIGTVPPDVIAKARSGAGVGFQQPAHHANRGGLAAAVGAKKAENLTLTNAQRHVVDNMLVLKVLVQVAHVDRVFRVGRCFHRNATSMGCPGCSSAALSTAALAITINTSLSRVSLL